MDAQHDTQILRSGERPIAIEFTRFALRVMEGPDQGQELEVERTSVRIGSSSTCDLHLSDPTVSREHCEIDIQEDGYLLRDLGSTNGTRLAGVRIREAFLERGTTFAVGETVIEFRPSTDRVQIRLSEESRFGDVLGDSVKIREMFYLLERIAPKDVTVLLTGETGVGKEIVAQSIHAASKRRQKPFLTLDCSAIAENLIESELFGHAQGAFTGASDDRAGIFEDADGGTVFLDEIGELPMEQQTRLLRVLEAREIKRVGENQSRTVDVRIIAATNRKLAEDVDEGRFRKDLFYRLSVLEVRIPPLRERRGDIPLLARHFLSQLAKRAGRPVPTLPEETAGVLANHNWPGNVRELRNVIERAFYLAEKDVIDTAAVTVGSAPDAGEPVAGIDASVPYAECKERFEKAYLLQLLKDNDLNVTRAAKVAGVHRQSLQRLLKKHGIRARDVIPDAD